MKVNEIATTRLANQHIAKPSYNNPKKIAHHMGALQAQSYKWVKWAMGLRLPDSTLGTIETAIAKGDIIRTHLLRPTWHVVSADDLRWMLELTAPRVKIAVRSSHKRRGLTDEIIARTNKIIEQALTDEEFLPRNVLVDKLEAAGFENKDNMASHLLFCAELDGVICSGPTSGKQHTYALFEKRVPPKPPLSKEESLQRLATLYFTSHGPATLDDFVWWSGLTKTMARKAIELIDREFENEEIDGETYWFKPMSVASSDEACLLPAYDEFIVGYSDRSAVLTDAHHKKVISMNGIFKPVIVIDGMVAGIWNRTINKQSVHIETQFFNSPDAKTKLLTERAARRFAIFLEKELKIKFFGK